METTNDIYVHPTAIVESDSIGVGTRIWAFTHVMQGVSIGKNCNIGEHCFVEAGAVIGENVTIKNANMIWAGITLRDGVFIGPNVILTNDRYPRSPRLPQARKRYSDARWLSPTLVERGASLGAAAVILPGTTIGEFSTVGAGSVVTRDVPPHGLVVGNPAHLCGWVCECGIPLRFKQGMARCPECERIYAQLENLVQIEGGMSPGATRRPQASLAGGAE